MKIKQLLFMIISAASLGFSNDLLAPKRKTIKKNVIIIKDSDTQEISLNGDEPDWRSHGFKHFPKRNKKWKDTVRSTLGKNKPAKYAPWIRIELLERHVWQTGIPCVDCPWKIKDFGKWVLGAKRGKETSCMRVELGLDNKIHGHPIQQLEYDKLIKKKVAEQIRREKAKKLRDQRKLEEILEELENRKRERLAIAIALEEKNRRENDLALMCAIDESIEK